MNRSLRPVANPLPGAGLWWETRASLAFVERNLYLVRRYWHLELAFLIFNVASAMSVLYIGEAQMQSSGGGSREGQLDLVLYLGIGTVVWAYLRAVFANVGEMVAWERWEGTIEYTMMAPISRLAHMLGVSLFSIIYGLARSALLLGVLALFFSVDLSNANLGGAALILLVGSVSFLGFGIMAAVLPLLFPERGEEMTFRDLFDPAPGLRGLLSDLGPAGLDGAAGDGLAGDLCPRGMRAALLEGTPTLALGPSILPILILGALTLPIGIAIFGWGERTPSGPAA